MGEPTNWIDEYFKSDVRTVLAEEQLQVPGLRILAKHTLRNAIPPLNWHYHENAFEITMCTKGALSFSSTVSNYKISGGDVFITTPNEIHSTDEVPLSLGEVYWFQLVTNDPSRFLFLETAAAEMLIAGLNGIAAHVVKISARESEYLIQAFHFARSESNPYVVASFINLFLHILILASQKTKFQLTPDIGKSLNYIMDHLTCELSLDELAAQCLLSTSQYKQKFKKQVGISPRNFINQQKIELAKSMLLEGKSITETAMGLGFNTSSYFATVFKRYTFYAPTEFLINQKGKEERSRLWE